MKTTEMEKAMNTAANVEAADKLEAEALRRYVEAYGPDGYQIFLHVSGCPLRNGPYCAGSECVITYTRPCTLTP